MYVYYICLLLNMFKMTNIRYKTVKKTACILSMAENTVYMMIVGSMISDSRRRTGALTKYL